VDEVAIITTRSAPASVGPFSQGTRARGFIFCSGQGAFDPVTGQLVRAGSRNKPEQSYETWRPCSKRQEAAWIVS
jgi:2-iminobutanoate/2-iminopropanoate deaminase